MNGGALSLAAVTAVLKNRLENGLISRGVVTSVGGDVVVSALPPDRIAIGTEERPQLNLFLYQITPRTGLSRAGNGSAPSLGSGQELESTPPLSLELHYLLTAYGPVDFQIEILLGHAIQLLQEEPVLTPEIIQKALEAASSTEGGRVVLPAMPLLAGSGLARQHEPIRITPEFLNTEDMSKLWSSLQARYRPSAAFKVSSVLIQSNGRANVPGERLAGAKA